MQMWWSLWHTMELSSITALVLSGHQLRQHDNSYDSSDRMLGTSTTHSQTLQSYNQQIMLNSIAMTASLHHFTCQLLNIKYATNGAFNSLTEAMRQTINNTTEP